MWIYDTDTLRFLYVNDAAVNWYGYSREEFLSMTFRDIRPAEDPNVLVDNVLKIAAACTIPVSGVTGRRTARSFMSKSFRTA